MLLFAAKLATKPGDTQTKQQLRIHHKKAEKARQKMRQDTASSQPPTSNVCLLSMDPEQVFAYFNP